MNKIKTLKKIRYKKIIVGNWKMNPSSMGEAIGLWKDIKKGLKVLGSKNKMQNSVVICPPNVYLSEINKTNNINHLSLGAQDVFWESEGSFTGQISAGMLKNIGVKFAIIGHSEKRALGETNENIAKKINACIKNNITPIVCIGESARDEGGNYFSFIKTQISEIFGGVQKKALSKIILAYEPIWAIGKNALREATPAESEEMVISIRKVLSEMFDQKSASAVKILFGGSVNVKNAEDFLKNGGVDGLLVGRESLDADKFLEIIKISENI